MVKTPLTRRRLVAMIGAAVAFAACAPAAVSPTVAPAEPTTAGAAKPAGSATSAAPAAKSTEPVKIGIVAPTTGQFALLGQPVRYGIELAIADLDAKGGISGAKIDTSVQDSGASNTTATSATQAALAQKPVAVLGYPLSTQAFAVMDLVKTAKIPTFVSGTNRDLTRQGIPWVFNMYTNDDVSVNTTVSSRSTR